MSSAPGMCQAYPNYTSDAPEDVSTALHGSGEGSLCTQGHASCGTPLYIQHTVQQHVHEKHVFHVHVHVDMPHMYLLT